MPQRTGAIVRVALGLAVLCIAATAAFGCPCPNGMLVAVGTDPSSTCNNITYVQGQVTVGVYADDPDGIQRLELYIDGEWKYTWTPPCDRRVWPVLPTYPWDTNPLAEGTHSLYAKGWDCCGHPQDSDTKYVTVDRTNPTCTMTAPANGATLHCSVTVSATASGDVKGVHFYRDDGVEIGSDLTPSDGFSITWDSMSAGDGAHTLYAKAWDCLDHAGQSSTINITVDNLPNITILNPACDDEYVGGSDYEVRATVSDLDGVNLNSVKLYVDDELKGYMTLHPNGVYKRVWDTSGTSAIPDSHELRVTALDVYNHEGSATRDVYAHPAVHLDSVKFHQDHRLWDYDNTRYVGGDSSTPQYKKNPATDDPICYTISSEIKFIPKLTWTNITQPVYVKCKVDGEWSDTHTWSYTSISSETHNSPYEPIYFPTARDRAGKYSKDITYTFWVRKCAASDWAPATDDASSHSTVLHTFDTPKSPMQPSAKLYLPVVKTACLWIDSMGSPPNPHTSSSTVGMQRLIDKMRAKPMFDHDGGVWYGLDVSEKFKLNDYLTDSSNFADTVTGDCDDCSQAWVILCASMGLTNYCQLIGQNADGNQTDWYADGFDPIGTRYGWTTHEGINYHSPGSTGSSGSDVWDADYSLTDTQGETQTPQLPKGMSFDTYKDEIWWKPPPAGDGPTENNHFTKGKNYRPGLQE